MAYSTREGFLQAIYFMVDDGEGSTDALRFRTADNIIHRGRENKEKVLRECREFIATLQGAGIEVEDSKFKELWDREIPKTKVRVHVDHDPDVECPNENCGWELRSFNQRHVNFSHPDNYNPAEDIGLRRKLECETAFIVSAYDHGQIHWALPGECTQCQWDTAQVAGILIWPSDETPPKPEHRKDSARSFLAEFTNWSNGECYCYQIFEDETSDYLCGCGGYIGWDHLIGCLKEDIEVGRYEVVDVSGHSVFTQQLRDEIEVTEKEEVTT